MTPQVGNALQASGVVSNGCFLWLFGWNCSNFFADEKMHTAMRYKIPKKYPIAALAIYADERSLVASCDYESNNLSILPHKNLKDGYFSRFK